MNSPYYLKCFWLQVTENLYLTGLNNMEFILSYDKMWPQQQNDRNKVMTIPSLSASCLDGLQVPHPYNNIQRQEEEPSLPWSSFKIKKKKFPISYLWNFPTWVSHSKALTHHWNFYCSGASDGTSHPGSKGHSEKGRNLNKVWILFGKRNRVVRWATNMVIMALPSPDHGDRVKSSGASFLRHVHLSYLQISKASFKANWVCIIFHPLEHNKEFSIHGIPWKGSSRKPSNTSLDVDICWVNIIYLR